MINVLYTLIACHFIGDYVLQTDFLAKTKGNNFWHMIVHCFLYSVPFYVCFGFGWQIIVIFAVHVIVDMLKAKWHKIGYVTDQCLHVVTLLVYVL